jgi:hypothetical protein
MEETMKSLMLLLKSTLQDCSAHCCTSTTRDYIYISGRVEHEGLSFLTITLGDFASDFEKSLEHGHIEPSSFRSFRKLGAIPKLFSGMLALVFNKDGKLLNEPSIAAISCIRQVCRMFKKIELPCTEERNAAAIQGYIKVEQDLSLVIPELRKTDLYSRFLRFSDIIWSETLCKEVEILSSYSHIPKHGTGAVATKMLQNQKYNWRVWHQRLEEYFPSSEFCYSSSAAFLEESSKISLVDPAQEQPVRVVFVPKTLKTPRVIAIEPACMQYTQQSLLLLLVDRLEKAPMTSRHINFTKQSINAKLALVNSRSKKLATMDLSEASDRVSADVVYDMLRSVPLLRDAMMACRSTTAALPNGITIPLGKYASMGSALCFPVESMVFYTLLLFSECERLRLPLSRRSISIVKKNVFVYGDDLILPVDGVLSATSTLTAFGLKVNASKSFSKGNFRESCGMDAYNGVDVTPVYIRRMLPSSRHDVRCHVSAVEASNQFYKNGFFATAEFLENHISKSGYKFPYVSDTASCVGYKGRNKPLTVHRYNRELHRAEVRALVVVVKKQSDTIDGYAALMKWFLQGLNPDKKHYLHSVRSGSQAIKTRWCPV